MRVVVHCAREKGRKGKRMCETIASGCQWYAPDDIGLIIDNAYKDYIEIELKDPCSLSALQWSAACCYIGNRLRPLSPLKGILYKKPSLWMQAPGAGDFFECVLPFFFFTCCNADKIPFLRDFWLFSGLQLQELPPAFVVREGLSPGYVLTIAETIKAAEKQGIESILTDKKTNTQGAILLLQARHGYTMQHPADDPLKALITADSLPVFSQLAQKDQ